MSRTDLLVTGWCNKVESVPGSYIMPPEKRPSHFTISKDIPVLDIGQDVGHGKKDLIAQIIKASEDYGLFQVINHGISQEIMDETMKLYEEFFSLPFEEYENNSLLSEDYYKSVRLYTSGFNYDNEEYHLWKDTLKHLTHPLEDVMHEWPKKPDRYSEVLAKYSSEVRKMSLRILDLICEGLGLEEGFFREELSDATGMVINNYPPCPEPSLALGIHAHCDPYVLTVIHQTLYGLQIKKDDQWLGVEPLPNAFVIMVPYQLQVISNGKLKSCEHRGVTNSSTARISIVTFVGPDKDCVIRPAKEHVTTSNPRRYKSFKYLDFQINYLYQLSVKNLCDETALGPYLIKDI